MFLSRLVITPVGGKLWQLVSDLIYRDRDGTVYILKAGYQSDGESSPDWAKGIMIDNTYRQTAAFVHDALYQHPGFNRTTANLVYLHALEDLGIQKITIDELYEAVRLFGGPSYDADQKNAAEMAMDSAHLTITPPQGVTQ